MAKVFSASEGYSVDRESGLHILAYREQVPSGWGVRKRVRPSLFLAFGVGGFLFGRRKEIPFAIVAAIITLYLVRDQNVLVGLIFAAIGAFAGYHLGRVVSRNARAIPPLTGRADLSGLVTDFQVQVEVDARGQATLYRELHASDPKLAKTYEPTRFTLSDIASIERRTWDEAFPNENRNPSTDAGRKRRAETRDLHDVVFVYRDGQTTDAGWKRGSNAAARLQADLLAFFNSLSEQIETQRASAARMARIDPDDAPL